jgi:hypothetical protein
MDKHTFTFSAYELAAHCKAEAEYHKERIDHWLSEQETNHVKAQKGAKVIWGPQRGGTWCSSAERRQLCFQIEFADEEAASTARWAGDKVERHRELAAMFGRAATLYGRQSDGSYNFTMDDVRRLRLGGEPRPE